MTYQQNGHFVVAVNGETYAVDSSLEDVDGRLMLSCNLNGQLSKSNVVFHKDALHLFTTVRESQFLLVIALFYF